MKLFAPICGTAGLMTAAINHRILSLFNASYGELETPLPALTRALLWNDGIVYTGLLLVSALVVFGGLWRKNRQVMLGGGIATLVLILGAATLVPAALMHPLEKLLLEINGGAPAKSTTPPTATPTATPAKDDSIRD